MITSENGREWYPVLKYGLYKNNGSGHLEQIGYNFDSIEEALKDAMNQAD